MKNLEDKLQRLRRHHRQNVFLDGAAGDRHVRALRRLGHTKTMQAMLHRIREDQSYRESARLLRMYA